MNTTICNKYYVAIIKDREAMNLRESKKRYMWVVRGGKAREQKM